MFTKTAVLDAIQAYFREQLEAPHGALSREFLRERGIDLNAARRWGLGYSPTDTQALDHLLSAYREDAEKEAATASSSTLLKGRLTFPIFDRQGSWRGVAARRLGPSATEAKYTFPLQGPGWVRSQPVYFGIDRAAAAIENSGMAVLVEGFTDVIACHLAGMNNVIGMCGIAVDDRTTEELAALLGRHRGGPTEIVVVGDGDAAGVHLTNRVRRLPAITTTSVAACPPGDDLCSLGARGDDGAMRSVIASRVPATTDRSNR